ncbi:MAG: methyltransferase domain-containing protein [Nitrospiraceae bacterium]
MNAEFYTPGYSGNAVDFMSKRSLDSHGEFFSAYLAAGVSVLDCGCGPGSITFGIAERVYPGRVVGIDLSMSQVARACNMAASHSIANVTFQPADCYQLPFADGSFDRIFSHALLEHLSDPVLALRDFHRVLKPGGVLGVCSPDWNGFILSPPSPELTRAITAYATLQNRNGGDTQAGRKLAGHLAVAGFGIIHMSARYECYPSLPLIAEYLAVQLERAGDERSAETFRTWSRNDGMFAQTWVSVVGQRRA